MMPVIWMCRTIREASISDVHRVNCEVGYVFKTIQLCKKDDSQFWKKNHVFVGEGVGMSGLRICLFSCNSGYLPGRLSNLSKMRLLLRDTENTTFLDVCMWIFVRVLVRPYIL